MKIYKGGQLKILGLWVLSQIHKEMTAYAMYVDNALRTNGIDPAKEAEKYYAEVDKEMRNKFHEFFWYSLKHLRKKWLRQKIDNLKQLLQRCHEEQR